MGIIASFFSDEDEDYEFIAEPAFDNIQIGSRNFDCVMVFDQGENEWWKAPEDGAAIQYEYLALLDPKDIEERKTKFPQHGADFTKTKQFQFYRFERRMVVKALNSLKLKVRRIHEMGKKLEKEENQVFFFIGINESVARKFADRIEYNLELEPQASITYFSLQDESLAKATLSEEDDSSKIYRSFWSTMFVRYHHDVAPEIYKSYDVLDEEDQEKGIEDSLFTIRDRLTLINEMITQDVEMGGAGIYVPALMEKDHCLQDFFPLHTIEQLDDIVKDMFDFEHLTYNCLTLPLDKLRLYFGEYIAIYFAYLEYFTWFLLPAAIVGLGVGILQVIEGKILISGVVSWFGMAIIIYVMLFPLLWKRLEFWYSLRWGTLKFDENERPRPEFQGIYMKSTIDGKMFEYFPPHLRYQRRILSLGVVAAFLLALGASVFAVIMLRIWVTNSDVSSGSYYVSIANAMVIMFFNNIYGVFAEEMNSWENYQTESEYEDQLIIKIFVFRFINSYAALYYYAFVRPFESGTLHCEAEKCMEDLRTQLAVIFISQLFVSNVTELGEVFVKNVLKSGLPSFGETDTKKKVWTQYNAQQYERTFDDYCELMISFGYCTLFIISFPFALACGFIGGIIEARIDGFKVCRLTRRPFPRQADDIGSWQFSMEFMAYAVLFTNLALICFVGDDLRFSFLSLSSEEFEELISAMIIFLILSFFIRIGNAFVAKKPYKIQMHEKRQEHLEDSLVNIGERIERYLDTLDEQTLENWSKWNVDQVCNYCREVLFRNNEDYVKYQRIFKKYRFDGKKFATVEEHDFQDMGIHDYFVIRFLINARRILAIQARSMAQDDAILDSVHDITTARRMQRSTTDADKDIFEFTIDQLPLMAHFFSEEFTGQSKKKLWSRVDKDGSSQIEKNELSLFVYYTLVVFIKSKYPDARIPKMDDANIKRNIIEPLRAWLLHYKLTSGFSFSDFDRYFPMWINEFYKEYQETIKNDKSAVDEEEEDA